MYAGREGRGGDGRGAVRALAAPLHARPDGLDPAARSHARRRGDAEPPSACRRSPASCRRSTTCRRAACSHRAAARRRPLPRSTIRPTRRRAPATGSPAGSRTKSPEAAMAEPREHDLPDRAATTGRRAERLHATTNGRANGLGAARTVRQRTAPRAAPKADLAQPVARGARSQEALPGQEGAARARPSATSTPSTASASRSAAARRSASSANPAAASRRSGARCCA